MAVVGAMLLIAVVVTVGISVVGPLGMIVNWIWLLEVNLVPLVLIEAGL
jgi:hypothetical protein